MQEVQPKAGYNYLNVVVAGFIITLLTSNILTSAKLVDTGFSFMGINLIFDGGLIVFPLCYIFGDILTEVYGFKRSRQVIWLGFFGLFFLMCTTLLLKYLPGETSWVEAGGQNSFNMILFGLYSGGLIISSLSAYLLGEFVNSILLSKLKIIFKGKKMGLRFILSTIFGQLVDNIVFFLLATILQVFSWNLFITLFLTNYFFKIGVEIIALPLSLKVTKCLKKAEDLDVYDNDESYNPFKFSLDESPKIKT